MSIISAASRPPSQSQARAYAPNPRALSVTPAQSSVSASALPISYASSVSNHPSLAMEQPQVRIYAPYYVQPSPSPPELQHEALQPLLHSPLSELMQFSYTLPSSHSQLQSSEPSPSQSPSQSPPPYQSQPMYPNVIPADSAYDEARRLRIIHASIEEEKWMAREAAEAERRRQQTLRRRPQSLASGLSLDSKPPSQQQSSNSYNESTELRRSRSLLTDQFIINEKFPSQRFVRHFVQPSDDLVDLAVRYRTTVADIRKHNRRVVFDYLDNVMNEFIHIPVGDQYRPPSIDSASVSEPGNESDDYIVPGAGGLSASELALQSEINRQFYSERAFLSQAAKFIDEHVSEAEARFYLTEANWNVHAALTVYKEDLEWERSEEVERKRKEAERKKGKQSYPSLVRALAEARQARLSAIASEADANNARTKFKERMARKASALVKGRGASQEELLQPIVDGNES